MSLNTKEIRNNIESYNYKYCQKSNIEFRIINPEKIKC